MCDQIYDRPLISRRVSRLHLHLLTTGSGSVGPRLTASAKSGESLAHQLRRGPEPQTQLCLSSSQLHRGSRPSIQGSIRCRGAGGKGKRNVHRVFLTHSHIPARLLISPGTLLCFAALALRVQGMLSQPSRCSLQLESILCDDINSDAKCCCSNVAARWWIWRI